MIHDQQLQKPETIESTLGPAKFAPLITAIARLVLGCSAVELELSQAIPSHPGQIADKLPPLPSYPVSHSRTTNGSKERRHRAAGIRSSRESSGAIRSH